VWSRLPPLAGANRFDPGQLKPGAITLAVDQNDRPLLVAQSFGAGRVMAFAGDTTWRWQMRGFGDEYKRFWRQIILWLARRDERQEGNVWVRLARRRLESGGRLEITVGANAPSGDPVRDARFEAEVTLPGPGGGTRPVRLSRRGETWVGTFSDTRAAGDYAVVVRGHRADEPLGQARSRFLVFEEDLELDNASADTRGMRSLAAIAQGRSIAPEQLPELLKLLLQQTEHLEEKPAAKREYWKTWPFFLLLVGLLVAEWYLRKRWGLV
jgi:hypothetical protein